MASMSRCIALGGLWEFSGHPELIHQVPVPEVIGNATYEVTGEVNRRIHG